MMKLTKYISLTLLIFSLSLSSIWAQRGGKAFSVDDFKKNRAEFLKKELALTPEEFNKFIPLSEELMDKKFALNREMRQLTRKMRAQKEMSDKEIEKIIDLRLNNHIKEAQLEKSYFEKFKKVLPMKKVLKYFEADMKFAREVMDKNKNRPRK